MLKKNVFPVLRLEAAPEATKAIFSGYRFYAPSKSFRGKVNALQICSPVSPNSIDNNNNNSNVFKLCNGERMNE